MQIEYGKTDLSSFHLERTVVLWASFLTGRNMEKKIPVKTQWDFTLEYEETFLPSFKTYKLIDFPSFSLKQENHEKERMILKKYFNNEATEEEYDSIIWQNHHENKKDFFDSIGRFDILLGYFDLADAIGHISFGVPQKMKSVYRELEEIAKEVKKVTEGFILILSDHGMKQVGRYGDHSRNGFYSLNHKIGLALPKITDFYNIIKKAAQDASSKH